MTALPSRRRSSLAPLLVLAGALAVAAGSQVLGVHLGAPSAGIDEPLLANPPAADDGAPAEAPAIAGADAGTTTDAFDPGAELARIRADVDFWAARLAARPADIVSAVKLAESDIAEARMTGDVTAYLRAESAADAALKAQPDYAPALAMRGSILVSLHRFPEARDLAHVDPRRQLRATRRRSACWATRRSSSATSPRRPGLRRAGRRGRRLRVARRARRGSRSSRATSPMPSPAIGRPSPRRPTKASRATRSGSTT